MEKSKRKVEGDLKRHRKPFLIWRELRKRWKLPLAVRTRKFLLWHQNLRKSKIWFQETRNRSRNFKLALKRWKKKRSMSVKPVLRQRKENVPLSRRWKI